MANNNQSFNNIIDKVNCKIVLNLLLLEEKKPVLYAKVTNYINESLTDEDKITLHYYLRGNVNQLMMCNSDSIMVACQVVSAMLNLLKYNIKSNMRVAGHKGHQNVDLRIVPKL